MELRLLWEVLRDRYKTLLLITAGFLVFAILLLIIVPTVYQSTAHIMVKKADEYTSFVKEFPQSFGVLSYIDTDNVLGSLDLFMRNDVLVSQVIQKCNLHDVVSFPADKFSDPGLISILFRQRGIGIEAEKDSEVFSIKGLSPNLEEAQKIANIFLDQFLEYYAEQKRQEIKHAKSNYISKAAELRKALSKMELEELEYRQKYGFIDFDLQKQQLIERLKDLNTSQHELKAALGSRVKSYDEILKALSRNPEYYQTSETISKNELIQSYKQDLVKQESLLAAKKLELTPEHPDVRAIEKQIAVIKDSMTIEKGKIFSNSVTGRNAYYDDLIQKREDNSIEVIKLESNIQSNAEETKRIDAQLKKLLADATGLIELVRQKSDLDTVYKSVDQAVKLLGAAEGIDISNFLVINKAKNVGKPKDHVYAPDASLFLALFGLAGLISGVVWIFLLEYADNAPRLFHSFEQLGTENRSFAVHGKKGWTLLAAELARQHPSSVAVLHRGEKGSLKFFTRRLVEKLEGTELNPFVVYVDGEYDAASESENSLGMTEEEFSLRKNELLDDLSQKGHNSVFLFSPLSVSAKGYLEGDPFDIILYVVQAGKVSFEDIKSDINFFYDRKWQNKVVGVFYAK